MTDTIRCAHSQMTAIDTLIPHPKNPNSHSPEQIERLAKLIKAHGFRHPIIVSKETGYIVAGHGRLMAAMKLGMQEVPVDTQSFESPEMEYAFVVADNAIADWALLDLSMINSEVGDLGPDFDIDLLGIKDFEIEVADKLDPKCDEDEVGSAPLEPKSKLGDLYELGPHRLMCGDSTSIDAVETLMNGEKADITFTSPPYNVGNNQMTDAKYENYSDNESDFYRLLHDYLALTIEYSTYSFCNIQMLAANKRDVIRLMHDFIDQFKDVAIWAKSQSAPHIEPGVMTNAFEFILVYSKSDANRRKFSGATFQGTVRNVIEGPNASGNEFAKIHKATFPVYLPEAFITNFTHDGGSVLDTFGGTGTTLIAAAKTNRKAYLMELDPKYVDVIVNRYVKYTGNANIKRNGEEIVWEVA